MRPKILYAPNSVNRSRWYHVLRVMSIAVMIWRSFRGSRGDEGGGKGKRWRKISWMVLQTTLAHQAIPDQTTPKVMNILHDPTLRIIEEWSSCPRIRRFIFLDTIIIEFINTSLIFERMNENAVSGFQGDVVVKVVDGSWHKTVFDGLKKNRVSWWKR